MVHSLFFNGFIVFLLYSILFLIHRLNGNSFVSQFFYENTFSSYYSQLIAVYIFLAIAGFVVMINNVINFNYYEYFFIDWEKRKLEIDFRSHNQLVEEKNENGKQEIISAWRSIFSANEFFELSLNRSINVKTIFIILCIILDFAGLDNWKYETIESSNGKNRMLIVAVNTILIIGIYIAFLIYNKIVESISGSEI